jgi:hypothetical protein
VRPLRSFQESGRRQQLLEIFINHSADTLLDLRSRSARAQLR